MTPKLTLNLGLRYELQGPWSERYDRMTYFNPSVSNASVTGCSGVPASACPGDLFLVKTGVNDTRNNPPLSKKQFSPRLGFAYGLDDKTVIRGGYGMFYIPNYVSFGTNPYVDPVSSATSPFFASNDHGLTPASTLDSTGCNFSGATTAGLVGFNCPVAGPFGPTLVNVAGRNPQPNISQYALNQGSFNAIGYTVQKWGYVQHWNFGIQRELAAKFFADVAYAGSVGVHLPQFNTNINQIPDSFIQQAAAQAAAGQTPTIDQVVPGYPFQCPLCSPTNVLPGTCQATFFRVSLTDHSRNIQG